jgi:hypothetical protein
MNECKVWPTSHTYSHHIKIKLGSVAVATTSFDRDIFKPSQVHSFSAIFITSMLASKPPRGCSARPSFCGSRAPLIMTSIGHRPSWNSSLDLLLSWAKYTSMTEMLAARYCWSIS